MFYIKKVRTLNLTFFFLEAKEYIIYLKSSTNIKIITS